MQARELVEQTRGGTARGGGAAGGPPFRARGGGGQRPARAAGPVRRAAAAHHRERPAQRGNHDRPLWRRPERPVLRGRSCSLSTCFV